MFCLYHWVLNESRVEPNKEVIHRLGLILSQTRIYPCFFLNKKEDSKIEEYRVSGWFSLKRGLIRLFVCAIESETRNTVESKKSNTQTRLDFLSNTD